MPTTLTNPGTQDEIDASHARYLAVVRERDQMIETMIEEDANEGSVSDATHDARDVIDFRVLAAAENLLAVLGYAPRT